MENVPLSEETCSILGSNEFTFELLLLRLNGSRLEVGLSADDKSSFFGQARCSDGLDGKTVLRFGIVWTLSTSPAPGLIIRYGRSVGRSARGGRW